MKTSPILIWTKKLLYLSILYKNIKKKSGSIHKLWNEGYVTSVFDKTVLLTINLKGALMGKKMEMDINIIQLKNRKVPLKGYVK